MRHILAIVVAGGLWLGMASAADAQFSLSIGNPYMGAYGTGLYGAPYGYGGYGSGYSSYLPGVNLYSSGYTGYSSGYNGYYPAVSTYAYPAYSNVVPGYGYGYVPYARYGYGGYRGFGGMRGFGIGRGFMGGYR